MVAKFAHPAKRTTTQSDRHVSMASAASLRCVATALTTSFFVHSALSRLADLQSHASFMEAIASYNSTVMKLVFLLLSLSEIAAVCVLLLPILQQHHKDATKIATACLAAAAFFEAILNTVARDTEATKASTLLFLACAVRLLETLSSVSMRTFHGSLGGRSAMADTVLGAIRDAATRYRLASICTVLIFAVLYRTLRTTDTIWGAANSTLRRNIALSRWYTTANAVAFLASVGSSDTSHRRSDHKAL